MMNPHMQMHPSQGLIPAQQPIAPQPPGMGQQQPPGLLSDMSGLTSLTQNPLFNVGMGLLAHRADASINPFQAAMQGLQQAQAYQTEAEDRERLEEQRQMLSDFFEEQRKALEEQRNRGSRQQSVFETAVSPSVRRGLGASALSGANQDLYKRLALQEILGM